MLATDVTELRQNREQQKGADTSMPDETDDRSGTGSDDVLNALDELETVLRENAESERLLAKRIAEVRLARENGREWKAILGDEPRPRDGATGEHDPAPAVRGQRLPAPFAGGGAARRGAERSDIAHLFGVTHQRVSNLLRHVAQGHTASGRGGERRRRLGAPAPQRGVGVGDDGADHLGHGGELLDQPTT